MKTYMIIALGSLLFFQYFFPDILNGKTSSLYAQTNNINTEEILKQSINNISAYQLNQSKQGVPEKDIHLLSKDLQAPSTIDIAISNIMSDENLKKICCTENNLDIQLHRDLSNISLNYQGINFNLN
jgi:hypothetical protein